MSAMAFDAAPPLSLAWADGGTPTPARDLAASPLALRGVTVSYGAKPALFSVDATFPKGRLSAVVGPNGAGKSTLLKAALGIVPSLAGGATIFGAPAAQALHRVAYVPQRAGVDWDFPIRVRDVVAQGLQRELGLLGRFRQSHRDHVAECLRRVGMDGFADRQIGQLSGGQQQRVFLARALAQEADVVLLDEPFAGVDAATERAVVEVLRELRDAGKSVIVVHHDLGTLAEYFEHVLLLNVRKIAEGPIPRVLTVEALQSAYGGRLADGQIARLGLAAAAVG